MKERSFKRVEGVGEASIFRGDPRLPEEDIDSWYQEILTEVRGARARPYLYGADAGLCARRNVLLEHNTWIAGEVTPASHAYMAIGVGLEDMLAEGLRRAGRLVIQSSVLVPMSQLKISGKIDLVVFDQEDELALIEVKSCGKLPTEPRPTHLAQIQTYAAVSGIHRCWLTYISRNVRQEFGPNLALRSFQVDTDPKVLEGRLATAALSRFASDLGQLPPVPAHFRKHTECHYCEFRDSFCYGSRPGLGGVAPTSPLPELTGGSLIAAQEESRVLANYLMRRTPERRERTLEQLLVSKDLSRENREKLLDLI